jgi:hypothetical protein
MAIASMALVHGLFLMLVVLNLVAGFQVLGTLMSVGLMMLPAGSEKCQENIRPARAEITAIRMAIASMAARWRLQKGQVECAAGTWPVSDAGGAQSGGGFPGARHPDVGRCQENIRPARAEITAIRMAIASMAARWRLQKRALA